MRARHPFELCVGFGERDVEHPLPAPLALEQKLQREGGLAGARIALHQIEAIARHAAIEHIIEPRDTGATPIIRDAVCRPLGHVALQGGGLCTQGRSMATIRKYTARGSEVDTERTRDNFS